MIKLISLSILFPLLSLASSVDVGLIVKKIEKLKSVNSMSEKLTYKVYDPFSHAKPILKSKIYRVPQTQKSIRLQTILNNKVLIDGKWYRVGNSVQGALIKAINRDNIIILRNGKRVKVSFEQRKAIIKLKQG